VCIPPPVHYPSVFVLKFAFNNSDGPKRELC
jgi:hypothetical protein